MISALAAAGTQLGEGLVEDRLAVGVRAALLHVGQVGLVGLHLVRGRRVVLVLAGGVPTARAVPRLGKREARLLGEAGPCLVAVGAPVRDEDPRSGVAALGLPHRAGADPAPTDGVTAGHS